MCISQVKKLKSREAKWLVSCYGLNVFIPHNSYVGALTPNGMVFEHGAFGRLGLDEIISVG